MIAPLNFGPAAQSVVHNGRGVMRLTDALRDEAALVLGDALAGVSGKRIRMAAVPGAGRTFISRCTNGGDCNPLYRIAGLFLLMKRLGMGRGGALKLLGWLEELIDQIWPPEDVPPLDEVLDTEQDLDAADDPHQQRIGRDPAAVERMLEIKRRQHAHDRIVILALRREIGRTEREAP